MEQVIVIIFTIFLYLSTNRFGNLGSKMTGKISTLTFLYTDVEGSTRLWEQQPEAMRTSIQRHNEIITQSVAKYGGHIFRTAGDSICASFPSAQDAVAASVMAQQLLHNETWPLADPLLVRMALHTGQVEENEGDYIGTSLNHIGRLLPASYGGQVVMTLVTRELVRESLPEGVSMRDLGTYQFRDLNSPEQVFQLDIPGLPASFPPLRTFQRTPNNLPAQLTSFIGRERELKAVLKLLDDNRLVTLTGTGGTGKTRLAIKSASELIETFPDGVWFIELAPVTQPGLIWQSLASAMKLREQPNRPLEVTLLTALAPKHLLIILDNCEHLLDACAQVCDKLLRNCPGVKILTSSRETLGIGGEGIFRVPPLSLPAADKQPSLDEIHNSEAVCLFIERATQVHPQFKPTERDVFTIAQICTRLDGIPLAIELAAARTSLFSPEQIATRLDDRFRLLTGGSRTALPRQQTLEALFDWSHDLLSPEERSFFRRLSVFTGGWRFEAAEAICIDPGDPTDALELLTQLVNKSMVVVDHEQSETRYHMLETTRQYAQKKLVEAGEGAEIRKRHMEYYRETARKVWPTVRSSGLGWFIDQESWLLREVDNVRTAQQWAFNEDLTAALEFASSLQLVWGERGHAMEMRSYIRDVLERVFASPEYQGEITREQYGLLSYAYLADAGLSEILGQNGEALLSSWKAVAFGRLSEDQAAIGLSLTFLAESAGLTGDAELAYKSGEEGVAIAREFGQPWDLGMTLSSTAAYALIPLGNFERAREYINEAEKYFSVIHDPWGKAAISMVNGSLAFHDGNYAKAQACFEQSLSGYEKVGDPYFSNISRSGLADVARLQCQFDQSIPLYLDTIETWQMLGNQGAVARCIESIAFIFVERAIGSTGEEKEAFLGRAKSLLEAANRLRIKNHAEMNPIEQDEFNKVMAQLQEMTGEDFPGILTQGNAQEPIADPDVQSVLKSLRNT